MDEGVFVPRPPEVPRSNKLHATVIDGSRSAEADYANVARRRQRSTNIPTPALPPFHASPRTPTKE